MRRSVEYGWQNTSSNEYLDHIKRMERSPTMHPDLPLYPNVHSLFKNGIVSNGQEKKCTTPQSQKKVHFLEPKAELTKNEEKNIDMEADGYIKQKHINFELHKWRTFKAC
ncbi:hypothetical protein A4A49_21726 [Nicotiana attenuata]|uniref:Uncharacterized protein n=1 Tax=Nicotiana attenuata TaxID=49451 RepID=A0A1J6ILU3_NICAT|nr:hypothetical protein A4A49_21726 [Nicotiana attenuata]